MMTFPEALACLERGDTIRRIGWPRSIDARAMRSPDGVRYLAVGVGPLGSSTRIAMSVTSEDIRAVDWEATRDPSV